MLNWEQMETCIKVKYVIYAQFMLHKNMYVLKLFSYRFPEHFLCLPEKKISVTVSKTKTFTNHFLYWIEIRLKKYKYYIKNKM